MTRALYWMLGCVLLLSAAAPAMACSSDPSVSAPRQNPFMLRLGSYFLDSSTQARIDGVGGNLGASLNFEDDLEVDERKNTMLAHFAWRFHECHQFDISYFKLSRSGETRAENEFRFGDVVVPIGADVNSSFTTEVTRVSYSYRILNREDWEAAFSVGLHVTRLAARLQSLQFDNVGRPITNREIASVTAPLPVLGFSAGKIFNDKWSAGFRTQWFFVEVDDIDGSIGHASAVLVHNTFDKVGFGIGYDWFDVDVRSEDRFWRGAIDVRFNGPMLFLQGVF